MSKVPEGSRCVNSESGNVDCPTVNSPLLPAVPRRGFLASLAATCGIASAPLAEPFNLLETILQPPVSRVSVAVALSGKDHLWAVAPTAEHITEGFCWKGRSDSDECSVSARTFEFFAGGRCYFPARCVINLPGDDFFEPAHWLDWPRIRPTLGDYPKGRLWNGLELVEYADPDEIVTRREAMQVVAEHNRDVCEGEPAKGWKLYDDCEWWVVVEMGAAIEPGWLDPTLCCGVGKVSLCFELACRIAVPTAAELERFGKGGAA